MKLLYGLLFLFFFQVGYGNVTAREKGILVVQVTDLNNKPVKGVVLALKGEGGPGATTDEAGRARIQLPEYIKAADPVSLLVVSSLKDNIVMVSPWDGGVIVPSFENKAGGYVSVFVSETGNKALLQNGKVLAGIVQKVLANIDNKKLLSVRDTASDGTSAESSFSSIKEIAQKYGLSPAEIDKAIREWDRNSKNNYYKGLAALYKKNYPEAIRRLLIDDEKITNDYYDHKYALASAYFGNEQYKQAIVYFEEAIRIKPDNIESLFNLASAYDATGNREKALAVRRKLNKSIEKNHASTKVISAIYVMNLSMMGSELLKAGQTDSALQCLKYTILMSEVLTTTKDPILNDLYLNVCQLTFDCLAEGYYNKAIYDTAVKMELMAISAMEIRFGHKNSNLGRYYNHYVKYLFSANKLDTALKYAKHAITLLENEPIKNSHELVNTYLLIALIEFNKDHSIEQFDAIYKAERIGLSYWQANDIYFAKTYFQLGLFYNNNEIDSALKYYNKAARIYQINKDTTNYKAALEIYWARKGDKSFHSKNYNEALVCYDSAWYFNHKIKYLHSAGTCHFLLNKHQKAIDCYQTVLLLDTAQNESYIYHYLGRAHAYIGQLDSAYHYFILFEARHIDTAQSYCNFAMYYALKNDKEKALQYLENAIRYGYSNLNWITTTKCLANIRYDERYKRLVKKLK